VRSGRDSTGKEGKGECLVSTDCSTTSPATSRRAAYGSTEGVGALSESTSLHVSTEYSSVTRACMATRKKMKAIRA
jgi:hypothetical protein